MEDSTQIIGSDNALPVGHRLQEYVIEGLIGEGGFGIVYLARDTSLDRIVALKEYMPASLARRSVDQQVSVRSSRQRETFELGRRSFVNEARLLAAFDHPALVKVYRFWEQHGTAYMVMPYYQGPTLKEWLLGNPSAPNEAWLLNLLHPMIDALDRMHAQRCYHRDIAPDNILLVGAQATQPGRAPIGPRPVLLDFGAARRVIGDATQALTVILKAGYAPIEQYADGPSMKQGPWTDVYALAAVLYAAIMRRAPLASVGRMVSDDLPPASEVGAGRYTPQFLAAIDKGLAVRPEHRPQDMKAFRVLFDGLSRNGAGLSERRRASRDESTVLLGTATTRPPLLPLSPRTGPLTSAIAANKSKAQRWAAGGVAVAALASAAWWVVPHKLGADLPPDLSKLEPTAAGISNKQAQNKPDEASPLIPAVAVEKAAAPAKLAPPFGVIPVLQDIVQHADAALRVEAVAEKSSMTIGRDKLRFRVKSSEAGYVYVFVAGTSRSDIHLLFPNSIDQNNRIEADVPLTLPRKDWQITASGPPGTNHIVTMVSRLPRDLSQSGLRRGADIPEFDLSQAERLWTLSLGQTNPLIGDAACGSARACDGSYGASLLRVNELAANLR